MFNIFKNQGSCDTHSTVLSFKFKETGEIVGENIVVATVTVRDYITAVLGGVLIDYDKNRGTGRLNGTKVRNIAENYDSNGMGVITVADWRDGTFMKADAHHRTAAIMAKNKCMYDCLPFSEEQLAQKLTIHLIKKEDFIRIYGKLNNSHGHSAKHKVLNTDLGLGSMLEEVFELQEQDSVVLDTFHTAIARCIYGYIGEFKKPAKELSYADISLDRKAVSSEAGLTKEEFSITLTASQKDAIANALDYMNVTYSLFKTLNNLSSRGSKIKLNQTARSILRNASLFGLLFWDKLSGREHITDVLPKTLALRITEKDAQIEKQAKFILNSELRDTAVEKIIAYIKTKKRI